MNSEKKKGIVAKTYVIEKIVDKRVSKDKLEYLLKLKDFPETASVWLPLEALNCPKSIQAYEDSLKCKSSDKRKFSDTQSTFSGCVMKENPHMNSEKKEGIVAKTYVTEKIVDKRVSKDKLEYLLKLKDLLENASVWLPLEAFNYPKTIQAYEDSLKCKSSDKRKFSDTQSTFSGCVMKKKPHVDTQVNINSLPEELLLMIFQYLSQTELVRIGRVCKTWREITRYPVFWRKTNVKFHCYHASQSTVAAKLFASLPPYVTHLKLDFQDLKWAHPLNIKQFCVGLAKNCPSLKVLIVHYAKSMHDLQSALHLCGHYMQNLEILSFHYSSFSGYPVQECGKCHTFSKIKILDLYANYFENFKINPRFIKMSNLKKLSLVHTSVCDRWFQNDVSFLHNLEMLNLRLAYRISPMTFRVLQDHALKLTELYLCSTKLKDCDVCFSKPVFPELKIICLKSTLVTCEGILSLIDTCRRVQTVYVDEQTALSYAQHPSVVGSSSKLAIVKISESCWKHYGKINYLREQ